MPSRPTDRGAMIAAMSDRGLPIVDGAPACPFVAFEDDRDERGTSPDHRHRCYAEVRPAPRALAHQEAYCLASAFPVCPTFQDWARREAARARDQAAGPQPTTPEEPRRNPPRDWAAPPPWSADPDDPRNSVPSPGGYVAPQPDFLAARDQEGRGLAGSAADRLAGGGGEPLGAAPVDRPPDAPPVDRLPDAARDEPAERYPEPERHEPGGGGGVGLWADEDRGGAVPAPGPAAGPLGERRPDVSQVRPAREPDRTGPSWERPRRYEAYPSIRTRMGLPGIPPVGIMVAAVIVAAVALFFLPALLGVGDPDRNGTGSATPTPATSAVPSGSVEPTATPAPTAQTYIVQSGDTMSRIASRFGVTLDDLIAANRENIPNPDQLDVGDEVIIPAPSSAPVFPTAVPSGEGSPAP